MLSERFDEWEAEFLVKGRQQGEATLLSHFLQKRFGELPESVCARLRDASLDELESWRDGLLDAANLDDVLCCVGVVRN
jgi:hypothetical protein